MLRRALALALLLFLPACSSQGGPRQSEPGAGGSATMPAAGGNATSAGRNATGGTPGNGGSAGSPSNGGAPGTGGVTAMGAGAPSGGMSSGVGGSPSNAGSGTTAGQTGFAAGGASGGVSGGAGASLGGATSGGAAGSGGACTSGNCPLSVITYPTPPGAVVSPLYTVTVNGQSVFVEKMSKFAPEMQVHYAHCSLAGSGSAEVAVTVGESFNAFTLSPKSRKIAATKTGNTITFSSGPNYLILSVDSKELLFILLDAAETNPPELGDPNVKNVADYGVDATGATLQTTKIQAAIDAASGATQNVLYFPPGKYLVGELWLKSNMTLYLAGGALLYGSNNPSDFMTGDSGIDIEGCQHGMIRLYQVQNTQILGRGVIDSNGLSIRAQNLETNLLKIEQSSNVLVDGIIVRDPSYWGTLIYRSDQVTIQNFKAIHCRPTTTTYNNTDGVDFDESTNGKLSNAFLYTGDDSMATKNEEPDGTVNTKNVVHEHVVCYSNSVCAKIGTKTMGQTIDGVVFSDIDVVKAGRALNIDAYDTAVVENTRYENIRIEAADTSMIALEETDPPTWRTAENQSIIKDTYFTNVASDTQNLINLHAKSAMYGIDGVHFSNVSVGGYVLKNQSDSHASWSINSFVTNITFDATN